MSTKLSIGILLLAAVILTSCSASKKLKSAEAEIDSLQTKNSQLTTNISDLQTRVGDLTATNKTISDQFNSYKKECQTNEKELKEVNEALAELENNMQKLEDRIEAAATEFQDKGFGVYSKDGVVHVDMEDKLLYKTGSASLSPEGKKALANLASVLNEYPKLKVIVVGNTDTMHVKGVKDNWSLSTERANGVVRILKDSHNIDPARLTSAGKGKFSPVADNSTAEGRAKNRRTEIVLNPDWGRIWQRVKKE